MANQCLLCRENPAEQTGSHIIPHFLLRRVEKFNGKSDRGYELGFTIQEFDTKSHFGRSVRPEILYEVYGELSDDEIQDNKHPLIVDNIFCKQCEKNLSIIENEYALTLNMAKKSIYSSGIKSELGFMFWASIIWRLSINMQNGMKLTKRQNEILRRILARTLNSSLNEIDFESLRESRDTKNLSYKLIRSPNFSDKYATCILFNPLFRYPYSLLIDEYIVFFTFNNNYNDYLNKDFFGLKNEVLKAPINKLNDDEYIYPIDHEIMIKVNKSLLNHISSLHVKKFDASLNEFHRKIGGKGTHMPNNIKEEIFKEISSEEKKLGRKHNLEDLKNSIFKVYKKLNIIS